MIGRVRALGRDSTPDIDTVAGFERIGGRALHWTVELRGPDWRDWRREEAEPLGSRVAARALDGDVPITTSGEQTSLVVAPPLIVSEEEIDNTVAALHLGLGRADAWARHGPGA